MQIHPLFSKNNKQGQLELFETYMSKDLVDEYPLNIKDYKKIQRNIYRMHLHLIEMNQQPDLNLRDNDGLIKLECYRIEKEWNDLKSRIKNNLVCLYKEKRLLDDWFRAFAELLDLKNEKHSPLRYH